MVHQEDRDVYRHAAVERRRFVRWFFWQYYLVSQTIHPSICRSLFASLTSFPTSSLLLSVGFAIVDHHRRFWWIRLSFSRRSRKLNRHGKVQLCFYFIDITTHDFIDPFVVAMQLQIGHFRVHGHFFLRWQEKIDITLATSKNEWNEDLISRGRQSWRRANDRSFTWWKIDRTDCSCSSLKLSWLLLALSISKYRSNASWNQRKDPRDHCHSFRFTSSSKISGRRKFINGHISLMLFCTGVPVRKNRLPVLMRRSITINWYFGFTNQWPSSPTNSGHSSCLKNLLSNPSINRIERNENREYYFSLTMTWYAVMITSGIALFDCWWSRYCLRSSASFSFGPW